MSLINKVLQDLDRRQAALSSEATVTRSPQGPHRHEWFWRVVTVLLSLGVAWVLWLGYQLLPRPLVPERVYRMLAETRNRPQGVIQPAPTAAPPPAAVVEAQKPVVESAKPLAAEPLKLAQELETPIREPLREKVQTIKPKPVPPAPKQIDKRDLARSASDNAETHFRRAALFLNHGRVSEAEDQLIAALAADPAHAAARQAYVALLLEQNRVDAARRRLQEALAINPQHPTFALALARIHAEQRDYPTALEIMDRTGSAARHPDFQALRGAVLQRMGRHAEAVDAYHGALAAGAGQATTWIGLGISLEGVGRRAEAATAYRKALGSGPLSGDAREYAEARARALD
ncbi:MAG TPA: tetratricopeptide repeat protein [Burkholderiales bacterium]|nr:tetratricopeptide repeat protein [Burkholderiales bacterium]